MKNLFCLCLCLFSISSFAQTSASHGTINWFDLKVKDFHQAEVFYFRVFKWQFKDLFAGYKMILKDGKGVGGLSQLEAAETLGNSGSLIYFSVDNLQRAYSLALASGGRSKLKPTQIEGFGSYAIVIDPTGNEIALYQQ